MPIVLPSRRMHSEATTQADLDLLSLLTADSSALGPLSPSGSGCPPGEHTHPHLRKQIPRRDSPMDALLLSAVIAGSGPVTRHHFGHNAARAYAACDESRPTSPTRQIPAKVLMRSTQAPRSERLRMEEEVVEELGKAHIEEGPVKSDPARRRSSTDRRPSSSSSTTKGAKPKRKMSIDPSPVAQVLQKASPAHVNYFHPSAYPQPGLPAQSSSRPQVRCMARTRIPTPHGELFLHLYHNSADAKEHLAIVIDPIQLDQDVRARAPKGRRDIRSRSLDAQWREGETDMERVVRGAYVGRLSPGSEGQPSVPRSMTEEGLQAVQEEEAEEDILPLVRIHSECFTGETIGSMRCDCGEQLDEALRQIAQPQAVPSPPATSQATPLSSRSPSPSATATSSRHPPVPGRGVVIYMRQEGRGIGLLEKIRAYNLQDLGHDTVTANLMLGHGADERSYSVAAEILRDLGLGEHEGIRLLTNNPEKVGGLAKESIKVVERVGMVPRDWNCGSNHTGQKADEREYEDWRLRRGGVGLIGAGAAHGPELEKYLRTKVERMGHMIDIPDIV